MLGLFGYNPAIEIDREGTTEQLKTIPEHYSDYIPLIEKNYETVAKYHTWNNRWEQVRDILSNKQQIKESQS